MKIVCDNCATKYNIADEKVRNRSFRIRCKKCGFMMTIQGEGGAKAEPGATEGAAESADEAAAQSASEPGWHVAINGKQVGPMSADEVRARFRGGEVTLDSLAWTDALDDWTKLGKIDEFKQLKAPTKKSPGVVGGEPRGAAEHDDATGKTDPREIFAAEERERARGAAEEKRGELFRSAEGAKRSEERGRDDKRADERRSADPRGDDGPRREEKRGDDKRGDDKRGDDKRGDKRGDDKRGERERKMLDAATAILPPREMAAAMSAAPREDEPKRGRADAGRSSRRDEAGESAAQAETAPEKQRKFTGERNENSVLFSLNTMQQLTGKGAAAGPAEPARAGFATAQGGGSGLIDIRMMAAQLIAKAPEERRDDSALPVLAPMVATPIMMPRSPGVPSWVWAVVAIGVLAVGGMAVVLVQVVLSRPAESRPAVATAPPATPEIAPAVRAAAEAPRVAAAAKPGAEPAVETPHKKEGRSREKSEPKRAKERDPLAGIVKPAAPSSPPETPRKAKSKGSDSLEDLLNAASPSRETSRRAAPPAVAPSPDSNLPEQLSRNDVMSGMSVAQGRAQACFQRYHVPGTALVAVVIGNKGKVTSASVKGALAGSPTAECVANGVKSANFKPFKGAPMTINYPFILR